VRGHFRAPLFLDSDPIAQPVVGGRLLDADGDGRPERNGETSPRFSFSIPCSVLANGGTPLPPVLMGHGLFGTGDQIVDRGLDPDSALAESVSGAAFDFVEGATDWIGLSSQDFSLNGRSFITSAVLGDPDNFGTLPDRLRQGVAHTLLLGRMMKRGSFNQDPAFQLPDGRGVMRACDSEASCSDEPLYYVGVSLGGIMGLMTSALSPDLERVNTDIPGVNFSLLMQRSKALSLISLFLDLFNPDPLDQALIFQLMEELWDSGEPAGYLHAVTDHRLPGSGPAPDVLLSMAWLDGVVSNQATEIAVRTLGLPNMRDNRRGIGSVVGGFPGIPDLAPPLDASAEDFRGGWIIYDSGAYDLTNPAHAPYVPPLANIVPARDACDPHGRTTSIPAFRRQLADWLQPSGDLDNPCDGLCDGRDSRSGLPLPLELPGGREAACDPVAGVDPLGF
jgi:hypothetical protein